MSHRSPDLLDVEPLNDGDRDCLEELREVLRRHNALDRFGINLLHDHFDLEPGELLIESCDVPNRTLTIQPSIPDPDEPGRIVETNWRFSHDGDVVAGLVCKVGCFYDLKDRHHKSHEKLNG